MATIPIERSELVKQQTPFIAHPDQPYVSSCWGPPSRVIGECGERSQDGAMCFGSYDSKWCDQTDTPLQCVGAEYNVKSVEKGYIPGVRSPNNNVNFYSAGASGIDFNPYNTGYSNVNVASFARYPSVTASVPMQVYEDHAWQLGSSVVQPEGRYIQGRESNVLAGPQGAFKHFSPVGTSIPSPITSGWEYGPAPSRTV